MSKWTEDLYLRKYFGTGGCLPLQRGYIHVYEKNMKQIFFSRTRKSMILKLGMKHQAMKLYKVCINHDPGMTLTFLRQCQLRSPMHLNGQNRKMSLNVRKLARNEQKD